MEESNMNRLTPKDKVYKYFEMEIKEWEKYIIPMLKEDRKVQQRILIKKGYFKVGDTTYVLEERGYPHDENCTGSMCWCASRAKEENPEKWKKYKEAETKHGQQ
jgi:hypothetical protein